MKPEDREERHGKTFPSWPGNEWRDLRKEQLPGARPAPGAESHQAMKNAIFSVVENAGRSRRNVLNLLVAVLILLAPSSARAQLAITEVMAYASQVAGATSGRPDFWELTNFGDAPVNLDGYAFHDIDPGLVVWEPFVGVTIAARESILLFRTNVFVPNAAAFIAWWGAANLPAGVQVLHFVRPGFDETVGDEITLLDPARNMVDKVAFGQSIRGRTKTYDAATGVFDRNSELGVSGAFSSALEAADIGSPGWTTGHVPISIQRQPASQTVDCCGPVSFSVEAGGVPRPAYQWTSNNVAIPGATGPGLTLPDVAADSGGAFRVILTSAGEQLVSAAAVLTVNTTPTRPSFIVPLEDATLFPGQSASLAASVRGYPLPRYQWLSNNVALGGATNPVFTIATTFSTPLSAANYTLVLSNALGRAESTARVTVMRRPMLQITEVMPDPTNSTALPPPGLKPWFELTNNDTNTVNLKGYRFRDNASLASPSIIKSNLFLRPGESMVFVDTMSRDAFIRWWGDDRLPRDLQVVTWLGWSLSSRGDDVVHLWNAHAVDSSDIVANSSYAPSRAGFSQELVSYYDEYFGSAGLFDWDSTVGVNGAFLSLLGGNVGSPGFTFDPDPFFTRITRDAAGVHLRCRFVPGRRYRLFSTERFSTATIWTAVSTVIATNIVMTMDAPLPGTATRFYRLEELP